MVDELRSDQDGAVDRGVARKSDPRIEPEMAIIDDSYRGKPAKHIVMESIDPSSDQIQ